MPRLIDDLRATGKVAMPYYVLPRLQRGVARLRRARFGSSGRSGACQLLLIDNVAEYFYQQHRSGILVAR